MLLSGKKGLVIGIANERSLAWGIAKSAFQHGGELALTYQNERLQANVEKLGSNWGVDTFLPCDVSEDDQIKNTFKQLSNNVKQLFKQFLKFDKIAKRRTKNMNPSILVFII